VEIFGFFLPPHPLHTLIPFLFQIVAERINRGFPVMELKEIIKCFSKGSSILREFSEDYKKRALDLGILVIITYHIRQLPPELKSEYADLLLPMGIIDLCMFVFLETLTSICPIYLVTSLAYVCSGFQTNPGSVLHSLYFLTSICHQQIVQ
jgi:hypothetical protein